MRVSKKQVGPRVLYMHDPAALAALGRSYVSAHRDGKDCARPIWDFLSETAKWADERDDKRMFRLIRDRLEVLEYERRLSALTVRVAVDGLVHEVQSSGVWPKSVWDDVSAA